MDFIAIFAPNLYSVKYDDKESDEYNRLFEEWQDLDYLVDFFERNISYLHNPIWSKVSVPEEASLQVVEESQWLENKLETIAINTKNGKDNNYDSFFKYLNGQRYELMVDYNPMKSYGFMNPSLIRMYAIKLESNCYVITGGGIKLSDTIQSSPELDHVLNEIDIVRSYMIRNGILDNGDLI